MTFVVVGIISLVLDALSFLPVLSWLSFPGFGLGLATWIWSVQMRTSWPAPRHPRAALVLGILGTLGGFAGIFLVFTLGSLLYGGVMVF